MFFMKKKIIIKHAMLVSDSNFIRNIMRFRSNAIFAKRSPKEMDLIEYFFFFLHINDSARKESFSEIEKNRERENFCCGKYELSRSKTNFRCAGTRHNYFLHGSRRHHVKSRLLSCSLLCEMKAAHSLQLYYAITISIYIITISNFD